MENEILFREEQKNRQLWTGAFLAALTLFFIYGVFQQAFLSQQFGPFAVPSLLLILMALVPLVVFLLLVSSRLTTRFDQAGIYYKYWPFHAAERSIAFSDIEKVTLLRYNPLRDFGGWGIRNGKLGTAYHLNGDIGLYLEMKTGKNILLGTDHPVEIAKALSNLGIPFDEKL